MSNQNRVQNQNNNVGGTNAGVPDKGKEKISLSHRILKGYNKFRATKIGCWTVRTLKAAGVGGGLFLAYKRGQASVKPTTVIIREGTEEPEKPVEESPAEESVEEEKPEE